jgi:tRNA (cmo5U34)-methyltransferase
MSKQAIDFDENPSVIVSEYDEAAQLALPSYEAMHTMVFPRLRTSINRFKQNLPYCSQS